MGSQTNLILYHGDCVDGFTAAWAARHFLGRERCEAVAVRYGEPMPGVVNEYVNDASTAIWIVDFSYPRRHLEAIAAHSRLRVIDHHKTAQADLAGLDFATFDMERSGAGLVWDELADEERSLYSGANLMRPWLVSYVEDRDLWRFALPNSREVNAYLRSQEMTFERWDAMSAMSLSDAISEGKGCLAHIEAYVRAAVKHAYQATLAGVSLPMVNVTYESCSEVADALVRIHDAPVAGYYFERGDGRIQYGLRSRSGYDCSAIAKVFGGGGHAGASGFVVDRTVHSRVA